MKYEKPKLIEIDELAETSGRCEAGTAVFLECADGGGLDGAPFP